MFSSGHHPYLLNFILFHSISSVKTLNLNKIIKTNNLAIKIVFIIYHILNYKCSSLKEVKVNVMLKLISLFCVKYTIRESTITEFERIKTVCDLANLFALEIRANKMSWTTVKPLLDFTTGHFSLIKQIRTYLDWSMF